MERVHKYASIYVRVGSMLSSRQLISTYKYSSRVTFPSRWYYNNGYLNYYPSRNFRKHRRSWCSNSGISNNGFHTYPLLAFQHYSKFRTRQRELRAHHGQFRRSGTSSCKRTIRSRIQCDHTWSQSREIEEGARRATCTVINEQARRPIARRRCNAG